MDRGIRTTHLRISGRVANSMIVVEGGGAVPAGLPPISGGLSTQGGRTGSRSAREWNISGSSIGYDSTEAVE